MFRNSILPIVLFITLLVLLTTNSYAITSNPLPPVQQKKLFNYCNEVQRIAKLISDLRSSGSKKADIISSVYSIVSGEMQVWIKPVSRIVYGTPLDQENKSMKEAFGFCETTLSQYHKAHGIEMKKLQTQGF